MFLYNGTTYTPAAPRTIATLVHNGDGTWTFTRRANEIFTFSSTGQLTQEKDLNGYATTLAYTGGLLKTITDPAGRKLTLTWSGGHIMSVADQAGRTVLLQIQRWCWQPHRRHGRGQGELALHL